MFNTSCTLRENNWYIIKILYVITSFSQIIRPNKNDIKISCGVKATDLELADAKMQLNNMFYQTSFEKAWALVFKTSDLFIAKRAIIMCNHLSVVDGPMARSIIAPCITRVLFKQGAYYWPIVGTNLYLSKDICIKRSGGYKGERLTENLRDQVLDLVEASVDAHIPPLLFPEGGRSRSLRMLPFRTGIFKKAMELKVPIQPMVTWGAQRLCPPNSKLGNAGKVFY